MWTDGRYFIDASQQLDCNWILMKQGIEDVPTMEEWLKNELKPGSYWLKNVLLTKYFANEIQE